MTKLDRCDCGRPASCWKDGGPCCATCKAIEDRTPSDFHPNHAHRVREPHDTVWSASTQRMVARGFAGWCVREHHIEFLLRP